MTAAESDPAQPPAVTAVASFLSANVGAQPAGNSVRIIKPPVISGKGDSAATGPYRLIRIAFEMGGWIRMSPALADGDVFGSETYDWSRMTFMQQAAGEGVDDLRRKFVSLWRENSICPDPRMYEVLGSHWLRDTPIAIGTFKHFLIAGHDAFIEVLAKGWTWESLADVNI